MRRLTTAVAARAEYEHGGFASASEGEDQITQNMQTQESFFQLHVRSLNSQDFKEIMDSVQNEVIHLMTVRNALLRSSGSSEGKKKMEDRWIIVTLVSEVSEGASREAVLRVDSIVAFEPLEDPERVCITTSTHRMVARVEFSKMARAMFKGGKVVDLREGFDIDSDESNEGDDKSFGFDF